VFVYYFAYGPVCDDEAKIRGLTKDWTHGAPIHIVTTVYRTPLALLVQNGSSSSVLLLPSAVLRCAVLTGCTALHCTALLALAQGTGRATPPRLPGFGATTQHATATSRSSG
jgi:hypothetical protein